jgi:hypothetical protein
MRQKYDSFERVMPMARSTASAVAVTAASSLGAHHITLPHLAKALSTVRKETSVADPDPGPF